MTDDDRQDARFGDSRGAALRLRALDPEDLRVVSALVQDAVFPITEMTWKRRERRFALLLNRVRYEDDSVASGREVERVQSVLVVEDVRAVRSQGIDRSDPDLVLSLLSLSLEAGEDGTGRILLFLAGDGAIELDVEALEVTLKDVTRPYAAPSGKLPDHGA